MNHPIDKVFQKVSTHEVQPSADAWERLQENMQKKKISTYRRWYTIAASLIIVCISGYLINQPEFSDESINSVTMVAIDPAPADIPVMPEPAQPIVIETNTDVEKEASVKPKNTVAYSQVSKLKEQAVTKTRSEQLPEKLENLQAVLNVEYKIAENITIKDNDIPNIPDPESQPKTLLEQIANTAIEIKNGKGFMSEVRKFKDDVVSLEFLKNKKSI